MTSVLRRPRKLSAFDWASTSEIDCFVEPAVVRKRRACSYMSWVIMASARIAVRICKGEGVRLLMSGRHEDTHHQVDVPLKRNRREHGPDEQEAYPEPWPYGHPHGAMFNVADIE